jgi:wax ester synthase-like acyl-CoA acyltransferase family protein
MPSTRARPLRELTLVEGIEDCEAVLIVKFHRSCQMAGGMRMLAIIADPHREPRDLGPMPPAPPGETPDQLALVTGAAGSTAADLTGTARRGAEAVIPALIRSVLDPIGLAYGTAAMARSVYRTAAPSSGAMSPVMRDRAMTRHLAMMEVSLGALKEAAKTADGTVNDAYLSVVTGGLRRYHERHGTARGAADLSANRRRPYRRAPREPPALRDAETLPRAGSWLTSNLGRLEASTRPLAAPQPPCRAWRSCGLPRPFRSGVMALAPYICDEPLWATCSEEGIVSRRLKMILPRARWRQDAN